MLIYFLFTICVFQNDMKCYMNKGQLHTILSEVKGLTFANPFGPARIEIEASLLAKLGEPPVPGAAEAPFNERFKRLLGWLQAAETDLLRRADQGPLPGEWREYAGYFAFFSLYHELVPELDLLIEHDANDTAHNRKLYRKIQEGVAQRHALIEGARERIWNQPEHLFACFYQLRRAFHTIHTEIIGESRPIQQLRMQVWESVFTQDMMNYQQWMFDSVGRFPTLVLGPSGSGKELVARAIGLSRFLPYNPKSGTFAANPRASFYPVNLSAISTTLLESELFGHRKGAFTGAHQDREGLFATAGDHGSVFLDEIGEVDEPTQVKLLRLLQSGEFQAVGDNGAKRYSGKIIAATHKDLAAEMHAGRFREDFYYRLCGDQVQTVALREILADSPGELSKSVHYICSKLIGAAGASALSERVLRQIERSLPAHYDWPGNFRELEQAVRNCIVRNEYRPATPKDTATESILEGYRYTHYSLSEWDQLYAKQAVANTGSYRAAAQRLGIDQRTVKKLTTERSLN